MGTSYKINEEFGIFIVFVTIGNLGGMLDKRNIFLVGPMGAGKSTIGRQLAQQLSMMFFDSDQEIERKTGVNISWVFDVEGESGFRLREEKMIDELTKKQGIVLATGGGSVISIVNRNNLSARGLVVYLEVTVDKQLIRTQRDKKRPLLGMVLSGVGVDSTRRELLEGLAVRRNPLYEEIADMRISTDLQNVKVIVSKIAMLYKNSSVVGI